MDDLGILRGLVVAIFAAPLVAAAMLALLPSLPTGFVRRFARMFAFIHVVLTALAVITAGTALQNREITGNRFQPLGVPGDTSLSLTSTNSGSSTTLDVFPLGAKTIAALPTPSIQFFVGLDGFNLALVALASLMTLFSVMVSEKSITERPAGFYACLFALESFSLGAFLSFDIVLFYVFFELTLIPAFLLIGKWGIGGGRRDAARTFFLYTLFGSLFTLVGIVGTVLDNPTPINTKGDMPQYVVVNNDIVPRAGPISFSIPQLMRNVQAWEKILPEKVTLAEKKLAKANQALKLAEQQPNEVAKAQARKGVEVAKVELETTHSDHDGRQARRFWLFLALVAGFAVKIPIIPFHTWLPTAYNEAPLGVTMYLSGVLAKLGTFGILRIVIPLVPDAAVIYGLPIIGFLAAVGIVYAAFCAYAQKDMKLLAAYSSVSHLGFLVLGLFALTTEAFAGAVLHMVNHAISTGMLFACLGFLYDRYKTTDSNQFGGLIAKYPSFAFFVFIAALAGVGLPGLCNFPSEMLMLAGLFDPKNTGWVGYGLATTAAVGVFLSAWYTFTMIRKVFFGPVIEPVHTTGPIPPVDITSRGRLILIPMALLCVGLGLFPQPILNVMKAEATMLANICNEARARQTPDHVDAAPQPITPLVAPKAGPIVRPKAK